MWCYQKPGFEALLLTELQRQQQCSQFCDTLLKTDGVSVPVHSCILSAISPHISSALSSSPPPPAGQSRLLEFRALGACTLLHVVRLLYCGEMAGEGEEEKQEAISAAAKLGIHGLVEVTKRDGEGRNEEGWRTEVRVQTEPLMPEENGGRPGRWTREVTDGSTFLWRETPSDGKKDTWTQTEQLQVKSSPPHPAASFETIDMSALQVLGHTDAHLAPLQIPYIPVSFVYPPDENQIHQPPSALAVSMQESTAAGHTVVAPLHTFVKEWGDERDERFERFQGNIPGYISYFLNPDKEEGFGRGRARRRRRGAGVGGARRAGTSERRARRPRARTGGRGRGGLTHTVDVQEVGVSRLQKFFLQRWGPFRAGQGGGAVGRKLYLKTRELLKSTKSSQRRRGLGKVWEFSQSGDALPYSDGGGGNTPQFNQDSPPVGRAQRARTKPTAPASFPSPHLRFYNLQTLSARSPSLQSSPSPSLLSPAASYVPPASPLLLSTSLPPPAPPPHEEQPEHFDRLLEEVMMGLDILPNNNNSAPHSQPPLPTGSGSCASCGDTLVQNKQRDRTSGLLEASPAFHGSTQVVAKARGDVSSHSELPALQQQGEGELNEMLDHFLQSFEQHVDSCTAREEEETCGQSGTEASQPYTGLSKYRKSKTNRRSQITEPQQRDEAEKVQRRPRPRETSARRAAPPENTEDSPVTVKAPAKQRKRKRKNEYLLSLEKKRVRVRKPVSSSDAKRDEQLQQRPVVKLERSDQLPAKVTPQKRSCLEVKSPAKAKTSSSSVKRPRGSLSTKKYPIRSRFTDAHIMDISPLLEEPLQIKRRPAEGRPNCSRDEPSSTPPIQPQPVEPRGSDEQLEKNQERHEEEEEHAVEPQEEAEGATKRGAESEEVTSDEFTAVERICFTLTSVRERLQLEGREKNTVWSELRHAEESLMAEEMEVTDVDGDPEGDRRQSRRASTLSDFVTSVSPSRQKEVRLRSTGSWEEAKDEDIDVIGGSSPAPEPVIISWTESSEDEEEEEDGDEDIDVVGGKTDYALSAVFATVSEGEPVNKKYKTQVLLHQHL